MSNRKRLKKNVINVNKVNACIYLIGLALSLLLIVLSFCFCHYNNWGTIFGGVGASGIGAVLLGFFIERASNCRIEKERYETREKLIRSLVNDIVEIVCHEILIFETEDKNFANENIGKSLSEVLERICELYKEQVNLSPLTQDNFNVFNEKNSGRFQIRHDIIIKLGGFINYTANDIYFNRSYNINSHLFDDTEIKTIKLIQLSIKSLKESENYEMYLYNFIQLLDRIEFGLDLIIDSFNNTRRTEKGFSEDGKRPVFISYKTWIEKYKSEN